MKKILAIAAAAALTAGVSAYAANPFSDVSPDDWAYQAVSDLSDQGVVEGYPDGTFKGERNMTRYELAQVIARLMAREDQLNAEQKATLDKLAGEYADELANLGVRVSNLEKRKWAISPGPAMPVCVIRIKLLMMITTMAVSVSLQRRLLTTAPMHRLVSPAA